MARKVWACRELKHSNPANSLAEGRSPVTEIVGRGIKNMGVECLLLQMATFFAFQKRQRNVNRKRG